MAVKTTAEKIYTAYLTGDEAEFYSGGIRYEFTPDGLRSFIESGISPTWAQVTGKPATFPPTIGTTATTAKAGNYQPTWAQVTGKPTTFAPTPGAAVADAVDETDVVTQLNALLASLRASGAITA